MFSEIHTVKRIGVQNHTDKMGVVMYLNNVITFNKLLVRSFEIYILHYNVNRAHFDINLRKPIMKFGAIAHIILFSF